MRKLQRKPAVKSVSKPAPTSDLRAVRQAAIAIIGPVPEQSDTLIGKHADQLTAGYLRNKAAFGGVQSSRDRDFLALYTLVADNAGVFTARNVAAYLINPFYESPGTKTSYDTGTIVRTHKHGSHTSGDGGETFTLTPEAIATGTKRLRAFVASAS